MVLLPDGNVLVTKWEGKTTIFIDAGSGVRQAEMWAPATQLI